MNWYISYRKKKEKKDANYIAIMSMIFSFFPSVILRANGKLNLLVVLLILLCLLLVFNYYSIYIKYNDKYKQGHSYVKRKFRTIGLSLVIIDYIIINVAIMMLQHNMQGTIIFLPLALMTMTIMTGTLVNKVWYNFDLNKYAKIDKNNPYQKRYSGEPKKQWSQNKF